MDKIIQPANPVIGVGYGKTATLDLAIGPRYHAVHFDVLATAASGLFLAGELSLDCLISMINVKINGKVQRAHSLKELNAIQRSYDSRNALNSWEYATSVRTWAQTLPAPYLPVVGAVSTASMIQFSIYFAEPWRKSYAATEAMAWPTAWQDGSVLRSFQIELVIPALNATYILAGSSITINAYVETDDYVGSLDANKQPIALINKWKRYQVPYTTTGDVPIVTLERRHICEQISIFQGVRTDTISRVVVKKDDKTIRDVTRERNDQILIARGFNPNGLTQDRFDVVFDYSDLPTDGLVLEGARSFVVTPTLSVAAAANYMTLISQIYGPID